MAKKTKNQGFRRRKRPTRQLSCKVKKSRRRAAPRPRRYDPRLEAGLKHMREGDSLAESARKIGATPAQLRSYAISTGTVERRDGKWHFKRDPRFRRMPLYSDSRRVVSRYTTPKPPVSLANTWARCGNSLKLKTSSCSRHFMVNRSPTFPANATSSRLAERPVAS